MGGLAACERLNLVFGMCCQSGNGRSGVEVWKSCLCGRLPVRSVREGSESGGTDGLIGGGADGRFESVLRMDLQGGNGG